MSGVRGTFPNYSQCLANSSSKDSQQVAGLKRIHKKMKSSGCYDKVTRRTIINVVDSDESDPEFQGVKEDKGKRLRKEGLTA